MGSWQASIIPTNIRARYTSWQVIASTVASMVMGLLVGCYIDSFAETDKQQSFFYILAADAIVDEAIITKVWTGIGVYPAAIA